ncbi:MAG: T9SS type A sorting domain-containing protein [Bacteroidia bacterium]
MKKITLAIFAVVASISIGLSQVNTIHTAPTPNPAPGTSGNRGPNGTTGHTVMRAMYNVPAGDMTQISTATILNSFGFNLASGVATAASGTLTVYLQNSTSSTYTNGATWSTVGMTQVFTGTYNIPVGAAAATVDFTFPSNFPYTGGALNVAYEYTAAATSTAAAVYNCVVDAASSGATGAAATVVAPTLGATAFRPLFRFGTPNTYTNEIIVQSISAPGKYPITFNSPEVITAKIMNGSNIAKTNIAVGLSITGANPFTNAQFIPSLAAGAVTTVTFAAAPTTIQGIQTVSVGVLPDDNSINNTITQTQSVTCDVWAYNPPTGSYSAGVGFGAGAGIISSQLMTPVASTLISGRVSISSDVASVGKQASAVLLNAAGTIIGQTNSITITSGMSNTFQNLTFVTPQSLTAGTIYYLGFVQQAVASATYYPLGSQATPVTPNNYYTSPVAGGSVAFLTSNLGFFGLEGMFTSTCSSVGVPLNQLVADTKISVFPNPTINGKATIAGLEGTNTVTVYNMLGQTVLTLTSDKETVSIDLVNQPMGNYLVKVTDSNKASKTVKIINQ